MSEEQIREYLLNRIVDKLAEFYIGDTDETIEEALHRVYNSKIYEALVQPDSYLVSQSPSYLYYLMMADSLPVPEKSEVLL